MARPIFKEFLRRLEADEDLIYDASKNFITPPSEYYDIIDCDKYKQVEVEVEQQQIADEKALSDEFEEDEFGDFEEFGEEFPDEWEEEEPDTIGLNRRF